MGSLSGLASPTHPLFSQVSPLGYRHFPARCSELISSQQAFVHGWPRMPNKKCSPIYAPRSPPIIFCTRPQSIPSTPRPLNPLPCRRVTPPPPTSDSFNSDNNDQQIKLIKDS